MAPIAMRDLHRKRPKLPGHSMGASLRDQKLAGSDLAVRLFSSTRMQRVPVWSPSHSVAISLRSRTAPSPLFSMWIDLATDDIGLFEDRMLDARATIGREKHVELAVVRLNHARICEVKQAASNNVASKRPMAIAVNGKCNR